MRRSRTTSRDSSQDSPVTDNERDIIWGDSPPPRRICLSTTPGRRVTRASAAEQDLTDLIECMHPKENKESSTPPLLGLWMRNRQEPDSGKKKHRPARLARRTTGRKLSRIGLDKTVLDDLRILTEWTGNLATTIEEPPGPSEKIDGDARTGGTPVDGGGDCEAMDCEELEDLFADDDAATDNKMETRQAAKERRKSSNLSFSDDLWDTDDWYDDDSIIRIATQVENEALSQLMQQKKDVDMISPTQTSSIVNDKNKMCQSVNQTKTSICNGVLSSNMGHSLQTVPPVSRVITNTVDSGSTMTRGSKAVPTRTWTNQSTTQASLSKNTSRSLQMVSQKPASTSYGKAPMYASRSNNVSYVNSKAVSTASKPSTSTHYSAASVSSAKPVVTKKTLHTNANMSVSSKTAQKLPGKVSCMSSSSKYTCNGTHSRQLQTTNKLSNDKRSPPVTKSASSTIQAGNHPATDTRASQKTARVPPMTDAIANRNSTSTKGQVFNDSLDDLFAGDNSLPDDMLLALLDNDSDFEEYTNKVPLTVPVGSNNITGTSKQLLGHSELESVSSERNTGSSTTLTHPMNTRAQYSSGASLKAKGNDVCRTNKYSSRNSTPKNLPPTVNAQSTVATHSRLTRSTAQSPVLPPMSKQAVNYVGGKPGQDRNSLSQPVNPSAKEGGVSMQRCCSQQEIEQKRQAALAKRKKSQLRVSPT